MVQIEQLVFGNVPAEFYSRHSGNQIVCASDGLAEADQNSIGQRLAGGLQSDYRQRLQYFRLDDGRPVIARTVQVPAGAFPGRRESFLAHALVLTEADFVALGQNPFHLFDGGSFVNSAPDLRTFFDMPCVATPVTSPQLKVELPSVDGWTCDQLLKLVGLAITASRERGQRRVLVTGKPESIERALRLIFQLVPADHRRYCTFDTDASISSVRPGEYWAIGSAGDHAPTGYTAIKADAGKVDFSAPPSWELFNPIYGAWLGDCLEKRVDVETLVRICPEMQFLGCVLSGDTACGPVPRISPAAAEAIERAASAQVEAAIFTAFCKLVGHSLACELTPRFGFEFGPVDRILFATGSPDIRATIVPWLANWLLKSDDLLKASEARALASLGRAAKHPLLRLLAATLGPSMDKHEQSTVLEQMSPEEYVATLRHCRGRVSMDRLACYKHAPAYLHFLATEPVGDDEFAEGLLELANMNYDGKIDSIYGRADLLSEEWLRKLSAGLDGTCWSRRTIRQLLHQAIERKVKGLSLWEKLNPFRSRE